jgi:hypothetical protein
MWPFPFGAEVREILRKVPETGFVNSVIYQYPGLRLVCDVGLVGTRQLC